MVLTVLVIQRSRASRPQGTALGGVHRLPSCGLLASAVHPPRPSRLHMSVIQPRPPLQGAPATHRHTRSKDPESWLEGAWNVEGVKRKEIMQLEGSGRIEVYDAKDKEREQLRKESSMRKMIEEGDMEVRTLIEEREDAVFKLCMVIFDNELAVLDTYHQEHKARTSLSHEQTTHFSLIRHSMAADLLHINTKKHHEACVLSLVDDEYGQRVCLSKVETDIWYHMQSTARTSWLVARKRELDRTQDPPSPTQKQMTEELFAALRENRRQLLRREAEEQARQEAVHVTPEPAYDDELLEVVDLEALQRHKIEHLRWCDVKRMHLGSRQQQHAVEEARHREIIKYTMVMAWDNSLTRLLAQLKTVLDKMYTQFLKEQTLLEHQGWLAARSKELDRMDREAEERDKVITRDVRLERERQEHFDAASMSYERAEADDRSLVLSEERWARRELQTLSNNSMKAAVIALCTRQVAEEMEAPTLVWTPDLWGILEDSRLDAAKLIGEDEQSCRRALESEEIHSYLRSRGLETRRLKQQERASELRERKVQAVPELPPAPELPELVYECRKSHQESLRLAEEERTRERLKLRAKWEKEEEERRRQQAACEGARQERLTQSLRHLTMKHEESLLAEDQEMLFKIESCKRREIERTCATSFGKITAGCGFLPPIVSMPRPSSAPAKKQETPKRADSPTPHQITLLANSEETKRRIYEEQETRYRSTLMAHGRETLLSCLYSSG